MTNKPNNDRVRKLAQKSAADGYPRRFIGYLNWNGTRPLYDDGSVGRPL